MNANSQNESLARSPSVAAWIGLDWGDREHAFQMAVAATEECVEKGKFAHSAESVHDWLKKIGERFGGKPVALALESNRGPLLPVFAQYPWLEVYPVNPTTSAYFRNAFNLSGAKDDLPDAGVILDILRKHPQKLRRWEPEDEQTRRLEVWTRLRRDAVDRRAQVSNQLIGLLKTYYPQALDWAGGDLCAPMALEFLGRWPDLMALKKARPSTVRNFYHKQNLRRPELVEQRLEGIKNAVALTVDEVVVGAGRLELKLLIQLIKSLNAHVAELEGQIRTAFREHPEVGLFRDLPGAGPALAPRLLAAFGTDRTRYPSASNLQKYAGIAPVREKSGGSLWTHWRWQAPKFLRQTFIEWAGQTVVWSAWAKCYYQRMTQRGKKHHVILRALAFKWIRILWKCWQTGEAYDEARYLKTLKQRKSPNFPTPKPATPA